MIPIPRYSRIPKGVLPVVLVLVVPYAVFELNRCINLQQATSRYESAVAQQDPKAALKALDEIMQLDRKNSTEYLNRAYIHVELGELSQAIDDYSKALEIDPRCIDALAGRARLYFTLAKYEKSIADYSEAFRLDPNLQVGYRIRGCSYSRIGMMDKAFEDFKKALELEPKDGLTYFMRGTANEKIQQYQKAADDYANALKCLPRLAKVGHELRASLYREMHKPELETQELHMAKDASASAGESDFASDLLDQEVYDDKILTALDSQGCKLDDAREIEHKFCTPRSSSDRLIAALGKLGIVFDPTEKVADRSMPNDWIQIVCRERAAANSMPRRTEQLIRLANDVGARYCGWAAELDSESSRPPKTIATTFRRKISRPN